MSTMKRVASGQKYTSQGSTISNAGNNNDLAAGVLTEDDFEAAFAEPIVVKNEPSITSGQSVLTEMRKINNLLVAKNVDWEQRIEALKCLRIFIKRRVPEHYPEEFFCELRSMDPAMKAVVEDLRSQVVREACITLAYMAREITTLSLSPASNINSTRLASIPKFEHLASSTLPALICTVPKSAKIMSTSATVAVRYLIRYTHVPNMIPLLCNAMVDKKCKENKSAIIRKACCEFLALLLNEWQRRELGSDDNIHIIAESIKNGINDADKDARAFARDAFIAFHGLCPNEAEKLVLRQLDATKRKMLEGQISGSSSQSSLNNNPLLSSSMRGAPKQQPQQAAASRPAYSRENTGGNAAAAATRRAPVPGLNPISNGNSAYAAALSASTALKVSLSKSAHRLQRAPSSDGQQQLQQQQHQQQPQCQYQPSTSSGMSRQSSSSGTGTTINSKPGSITVDGDYQLPHASSSSPYGRSTSAVDPVAARRAKARALYSNRGGGLLLQQQKSAAPAAYYAVNNNDNVVNNFNNHAAAFETHEVAGSVANSSFLSTVNSITNNLAGLALNASPLRQTMNHNSSYNNSNTPATTRLPPVRDSSASSSSNATAGGGGGSSGKRPPRRVAQSQPSSRSASPHRHSNNLLLSGNSTASNRSKIPTVQHSHLPSATSADNNEYVYAKATPIKSGSKIPHAHKSGGASVNNSNMANQSLYLIDLTSPMPKNYGNNNMPTRLQFTPRVGGAAIAASGDYMQNNNNNHHHHNDGDDNDEDILNGGAGDDEIDDIAAAAAHHNNNSFTSTTSTSSSSASSNNINLISQRLLNAVSRLQQDSSTDDVKREAMSDVRLMFKQRCAEWPRIWDMHFDKVLYALIEVVKEGSGSTVAAAAALNGQSSDASAADGINNSASGGGAEYELRTRALGLIAVMAQLQPLRMERYAEYVIVEVLEARCVVEPKADMERRRAFDALNKHVEDCALQVGLALSFKRVVQILMPLIKSTNFPLNESAIKMFGNVIRNIPAEQVRECIGKNQELVKVLVRQFDEGQQISIRKESVFTLAYLVHKLGADAFFALPCVSALNDSRKHLIKLYVGKTSSSSTTTSANDSSSSINNDSILQHHAAAAVVDADAPVAATANLKPSRI